MRKITARQRVLALALVGSILIPMLPALDGGALAKQEVEIDSFTVNDSRNDQLHPRIDGDLVVWQDYRDIGDHNGDDGNADIYVFDIDSRDEFKVSDNHTSSRPDIDGEIVVYTDKRDGDLDVRGYNVRTDESFWVARRSGSDQDRAAIDGDLVVWQDNREGNWDIRGRDLDDDDDDGDCDERRSRRRLRNAEAKAAGLRPRRLLRVRARARISRRHRRPCSAGASCQRARSRVRHPGSSCPPGTGSSRPRARIGLRSRARTGRCEGRPRRSGRP
jgi:beta propeller repeat protein